MVDSPYVCYPAQETSNLLCIKRDLINCRNHVEFEAWLHIGPFCGCGYFVVLDPDLNYSLGRHVADLYRRAEF